VLLVIFVMMLGTLVTVFVTLPIFNIPETGIFTSKYMNATEHDINNPSKNPNDNKHQ
jgi:hypothetical protein